MKYKLLTQFFRKQP